MLEASSVTSAGQGETWTSSSRDQPLSMATDARPSSPVSDALYPPPSGPDAAPTLVKKKMMTLCAVLLSLVVVSHGLGLCVLFCHHRQLQRQDEQLRVLQASYTNIVTDVWNMLDTYHTMLAQQALIRSVQLTQRHFTTGMYREPGSASGGTTRSLDTSDFFTNPRPVSPSAAAVPITTNSH